MIACMACPHPNTDHARQDQASCLVEGCACTDWQEPLLSFPIADYGGIKCSECDRDLVDGMPVKRTPVAMAENETVICIVSCVYCDPQP